MIYAHNEWIILEKLVGIILENVPGCIVEIGCGISTLVLADQARATESKLYTCDTVDKRIKWVMEIAKYDNLIPFCGRSSEFMKIFNDTPSIVLLDGCHQLNTVGEEVEFFLGKLNIGGVMFLHDTCPWINTFKKKKAQGKEIDTYLVRKELEQNPNVDVFTWRYTASKCGLTMVLKKDMSEPEYRR